MIANFESLVDESIQRSRWLRLRPDDSRWLLSAGVEYADRSPADGDLAAGLRSHLAELVRQRYGNPLVLFLLLKIVLPIVIELILRWWLERNRG